MDELWQRYRTFWNPVLIGLGVFLVGVIVVHMLTKDPEVLQRKLKSEQNKLKRLKAPPRGAVARFQERTRAFEADIGTWAERLDQSRSAGDEIIPAAVDQALRAAILRGASDEEAKSRKTLAERFEGDEVAADRARRRFTELQAQHTELLSTGDPNVAFSRLLSEVWSEMRVRANRADMELIESLGFNQVASVDRATLPGRAMTLALVARVVDEAIRSGMRSIDRIALEPNLKAGQGNDLLVEWPIVLGMEGPFGAVLRVVDLLTDPSQPAPVVDGVSISQPRTRAGQGVTGNARLEMSVASLIVRPGVDLGLEREQE